MVLTSSPPLDEPPTNAAALNAHAVVLQLWMLTSYVVDGFADAGTMLGSKRACAGLESATRSGLHHARSLFCALRSPSVVAGSLPVSAVLGAKQVRQMRWLTTVLGLLGLATGLLAGGIASGVQMAISASNTGGAWDNAKKCVDLS